MTNRIVLTACVATAMVGGDRALAGPAMEVASGFDEGERPDVNLSVAYQLSARRGSIKREFAGLANADPDGATPIAKDLQYSTRVHTIVPRLEVGFFRDLSFSFQLPVTLSHAHDLVFDQDANPCVFPGGNSPPTCINADNSSTVTDGLLPATGFNSDNPGGPGFTDADDGTIFRSPQRSGLDQLFIGLTWAPMNQARDSTKPTWKIGGEVRASVGKLMRFDRNNPSSQTGVSRGVHELALWTSIAKRMTWAEPYWQAHYIAPIGTRGDAFAEPGFGQVSVSPMQRAGTDFGFFLALGAPKSKKRRVTIDMAATVDAHFEGRGYSEMWEVFALAGDAGNLGPLTLDSDPVTAGQQAASHPGVTNIENYLRLGARLGIEAEYGEVLRFGISTLVTFDQSHLISFADAGVDGGDDDSLVTPGTGEVNPVHVPIIDSVGRRYRVDDVVNLDFNAHIRVLF